ncbi:MAG: hypothetical protein VYA34_11825 [Myxococcota bacterium]|nr:hypothetical protein [Myxococcota bacterium]
MKNNLVFLALLWCLPAAAYAAEVSVSSDDAKKTAEEKPRKNYGVSLSLTHAVGSASFLQDDTLRASRGLVYQAWGLSGFYSFDILGQKFKVSPRMGFTLELTEPDSNPARRFDPSDSSLSLSASGLKDDLTGIGFSPYLRVTLPTSYRSLNINKRWVTLKAGLGLNRTFGDFSISLATGFTKAFSQNKVSSKYTETPRLSDFGNCNVASAGEGGIHAVYECVSGSGTLNFAVTSNIGFEYQILETLSISYSVSLSNSFRHAIIDEEDDLTAPHADTGMGRSDSLSESLALSFSLSELLTPDSPVSYRLSLSMDASHPAQTADNRAIMWPFFYNSFGQNRAANNYGEISLGISGSY